MKKINLYLTSMAIMFLLTGCLNELDNYDAPDGGITGKILDAETNEPVPLPVQGSTGTIINLYELNTDATKSVDFYAKYDGTYENTQVFNGDYEIVVNGPFVSPCKGNVTVKGQTSYDLKALPYARINASATVSGGVVTVQYAVNTTSSSFKVSDVYGYWNFAPGVDDGVANYAEKITVTETSGEIKFDLNNNQTYKNNHYKIQANGNRIYVRIGAKVDGNVNYSVILTVTV
ncbi:MAG: DUF3823 domain-containing protein [Tannerella sp.]|jgi:hypothetical protein|nr:DUF3823 domain-containing protein [Tannerella sp.]